MTDSTERIESEVHADFGGGRLQATLFDSQRERSNRARADSSRYSAGMDGKERDKAGKIAAEEDA